MARSERYYLTDATRKTSVVLLGPPIAYDGAEISLKQSVTVRKPIVPLPDRLEAPSLFDFRFFRTPGTAIKDSGSQGTVDDFKRIIDYTKDHKNG